MTSEGTRRVTRGTRHVEYQADECGHEETGRRTVVTESLFHGPRRNSKRKLSNYLFIYFVNYHYLIP